MSNAQISRIETRAQRILSKAVALGFTKNGSPMVIDQAREIVAAEDGHRNWHALRSSALKEVTVSPTVAPGVCSQMLHALNVAMAALDRLAEDEEFDHVVEDLGVTAIVTAATIEAEKAGITCKPVYSEVDPLAEFELVHADECARQGWALFESEGEWQIQACSDAEVFDNDDDAWLFVIKEAAQVPDSAAARALNFLREHSPEEFKRIVDWDRANESLLQLAPSTSVGHPVDLAEVAEWVGQHYRVSFDSAGARQQEWIDRFAAAHGDDERFKTYLVSEHWGHIFVATKEETTRWVYQLGGKEEGVVFAQISINGKWVTLNRDERGDLEQSIRDNDVPDTYRKAWSSEVKPRLTVPAWAHVGPEPLAS